MSASNMLRQDATDTLAKGLDITTAEGHIIDYPWDLVAHNERLLVEERPNKHELRGTVENGAHLIRSERVTTGKGSRIMPGAVLDASEGPIVIEEQVTVSPLAIVQGPCFIGRNCFVHPGASIRHFCSIGPLCKLGGEIEATIFQGFSNKQHDGFLGHAWIGQWVNLGADTVNSDLKNTYGSVRVPINGAEIDSGRTFVGAFLADHAKTGIGQTFSTGSVVGFAASVATSAFPPKFIPSFSWMTDNGIEEYKLERCLAVAQKVMARREVTMTGAERTLFRSLPALCRSIEHNSTAR